MCKRVIDIVLSLTGMITAWPFMLLIALAIRLESPGRIIFSQERLGLNGKRFMMHKFRKFPDNWGNAGSGVTVTGDARMTRVGKFLERTKLDELPQLWNILLGEMSLVGPRPESMKYADLFSGEFAAVLDHMPGIFGPNQVAFRNESELYPHDQDPEYFYRTVLFPQKAKHDAEYFVNSNCFDDLLWIFQGVWISLHGAVNWHRIFGLHVRILAVDILAIECGWILAHLLRFGKDFVFEEKFYAPLVTGLWLFPFILIPLMILGGCYCHAVRHFSIVDVIRLGRIVSLSWLLAYLLFLGFFHRNTSILLGPLGLLISLCLMIGPRLWRRESWQQDIMPQGCSRFKTTLKL